MNVLAGGESGSYTKPYTLADVPLKPSAFQGQYCTPLQVRKELLLHVSPQKRRQNLSSVACQESFGLRTNSSRDTICLCQNVIATFHFEAQARWGYMTSEHVSLKYGGRFLSDQMITFNYLFVAFTYCINCYDTHTHTPGAI